MHAAHSDILDRTRLVGRDAHTERAAGLQARE